MKKSEVGRKSRKITPENSSITYRREDFNSVMEMSHGNQSQSALEYSKDRSSLEISASKDKSSDLVSLTNSFSRRGLELSK